MKNYIQAWRSSMLSESSNPLLLNEGIFDLGLPAGVAESINKDFEGVHEKGKTIIGNIVKNQMFRRLPRRYSSPIINDVNDLLDQIKQLSIDIATGENSKWLDLPVETRNKMIEFWNNMEVILTGDKDGVTQPENYYWDVKVGDVQKVVKMANRAFNKGIISKINGGAVNTDMFDTMASHIYDDYALAIGELTLDVQTWLKSHAAEYKKMGDIIEKSDYQPLSAIIKHAKNWLADSETEEQKMHTFDDTSYWYDLQTDSCPVEAERMGHCGGDTRATTLLSLRYKGKGKQKSSSYITVAYNPDTNTIYQIKGKFNKAPEEKYYKHIAWLIEALGNPKVVEKGEHSDDLEGFIKMAEWLEENTDAKISKVANSWEEMERELNQIVEAYNEEYFYSKLFAEMADPRGLVDPTTATYYFRGLVGVPIELEELSEEGQQKLKDGKYTRDEITAISRLMDDPRASGKITSTTGGPPIIKGDSAIFFFYAADRVTSGVSENEWSDSEEIEDLRSFASDLMDMDREASVSGNRLQRDLARALIATGFMDGGPFLNLYMGVRDGELQEDSDWIVETDVDGDDSPKLVWFQTPQIYFDLKRLERDGIDDELEYYRKPQVIEKILNSNTFKKNFMVEMSKAALTTESQVPNIQSWDVVYENYNPPKFVIEAAWMVDKEDNDSKIEVSERWLAAEFGKGDFEDMLHAAYSETLSEAIGDDWLTSQTSMDFPGGKRLAVNESVSHKNIIKKWKSFQGFLD